MSSTGDSMDLINLESSLREETMLGDGDASCLPMANDLLPALLLPMRSKTSGSKLWLMSSILDGPPRILTIVNRAPRDKFSFMIV
ncbi:hypothetical protein WICPIJ_001365 [Wickerhamomyces pijperi]|uniref:Uncharacterized protein n=1 Tax=Wickerhamomyces pijperi TaxID=599730 RepID=A0A9P8TPZ3_WICPI|nr:hypothetical protein WICPIJ_001365 [Wickerhamomyces pijperi]